MEGKIVVVEPHSDDAFLSLGWHLEKIWEELEKVIITVYSSPVREREARSFAYTVGAEHISMELEGSKMENDWDGKTVPGLLTLIYRTGYDHIIFPIGLQHPDHLAVAATERLLQQNNVYQYLDTPYQTKFKLADEVLEKTRGMVIDSICYPPKKKWRHSKLFESQAKFFHYNPMENLKIPEMVLVRP